MPFDDFDLEIENSKESEMEHFDGSVTTAGTPVVITPTNGRPIRFFYVNVPGVRNPTPTNSINDAIKISIDGGSTYVTIMSGDDLALPGIATNLTVDTNNNGTIYEIIVWS